MHPQPNPCKPVLCSVHDGDLAVGVADLLLGGGGGYTGVTAVALPGRIHLAPMANLLRFPGGAV